MLAQETPPPPRSQGERPVQYVSRHLNLAEQKYATIAKEALAVKWAIEVLLYYLWDAPFTVVMDHAPLIWLQQMKDTHPR